MRPLLAGAVQRRPAADQRTTCEDGGGGSPSAAEGRDALRAWMDGRPHTAACRCKQCQRGADGRVAEPRDPSRKRPRRARMAEGGGAAPGGVGEARSAERGVSRVSGEGAEHPGAGGCGGRAAPRSREGGRSVANDEGKQLLKLRESLRPLAISASVRFCGCVPIHGEDGIDVVLRGDGAAAFVGVQQDGSPWCCPVCADALRRERADVLTRVMAKCPRCGRYLVSLTISHARGHSLRQMRRAVAAAWRRIRQHRRWRAWCAEHYFGDVRALEVTFGGYAGWHPHLHLVLLTKRPLTDDERVVLWQLLDELWRDAVVRELGPNHAPSTSRGVDVRPARDASYLAKMGLDGLGAELADPALAKEGKRGGHLTPWQIAWRAAEGGRGYQALWREWQEGMQRAHQLEYSDSLRPLKAEAEQERAAEIEEARQDAEAGGEGDEVVVRLPLRDWGEIVWARLNDGRLARLAILEAVEAGGDAAAVMAIVQQVRCERVARGARSWTSIGAPDG